MIAASWPWTPLGLCIQVHGGDYLWSLCTIQGQIQESMKGGGGGGGISWFGACPQNFIGIFVL